MKTMNSFRQLNDREVRSSIGVKVIRKHPEVKPAVRDPKIWYVTLPVAEKQHEVAIQRRAIAVNQFWVLTGLEDILTNLLNIFNELCDCCGRSASHIVNDKPCCGNHSNRHLCEHFTR